MSLTTTTNNPLLPNNMNDAVRLADVMSKGRLMPAHFHNQPGDCLMVIEQAMRWGMSPFAVAQSTSVIQGKLMFEGKLVAAAVHASGVMKGRLSYDYEGDGDKRTICVSGTLAGEAVPRTLTVAIKDARTSNKMWQVQPDQQLAYFGARAWARRHVPEVMLGVYSPEEWPAQDAPVVTVDDAHTITVQAEVALEPKRKSVSEWLDALELELRGATTSEAVMAIYARDDVRKADERLTNGAHLRLTDMLDAALARTAPAPAAEEDDGWPGAKA